jgi:hypothetical protein
MKQRNFEDMLNRLDEYLATLDDDAFFTKLGTSLEELTCKSIGVKKMIELKSCPFCGESVSIGVHDDEGNYKGELGCDYENDPWGGLYYGLHHPDLGACFCCTDGNSEIMGGMLFDTAEEAAEVWNMRANG